MDFITALWKKISFRWYLLNRNKCKGKIQQVKVNKKNILTSISYRIWWYTSEWMSVWWNWILFPFYSTFCSCKMFCNQIQQVENWKSWLFSQRWSATSKRKLCYLLFSKQNKTKKKKKPKQNNINKCPFSENTNFDTHTSFGTYVCERESVCVCACEWNDILYMFLA